MPQSWKKQKQAPNKTPVRPYLPTLCFKYGPSMKPVQLASLILVKFSFPPFFKQERIVEDNLPNPNAQTLVRQNGHNSNIVV